MIGSVNLREIYNFDEIKQLVTYSSKLAKPSNSRCKNRNTNGNEKKILDFPLLPKSFIQSSIQKPKNSQISSNPIQVISLPDSIQPCPVTLTCTHPSNTTHTKMNRIQATHFSDLLAPPPDLKHVYLRRGEKKIYIPFQSRAGDWISLVSEGKKHQMKERTNDLDGHLTIFVSYASTSLHFTSLLPSKKSSPSRIIPQSEQIHPDFFIIISNMWK